MLANVPLTRVMALHAVAYCERLFYLEEVEEIRLADERVHAGRLLHEQLPDEQRIGLEEGGDGARRSSAWGR